jgi:peptidoglycan/LPS O-acetylase OafA/YrhL
LEKTKGNHGHLSSLDVLRAFAFFAVFMRHSMPLLPEGYRRAGLPQPLAELVAGAVSAGQCGVDLFFVLSSWLITTLLLKEIRENGTVNLRLFYIRRGLRIWPLYFGFLLLCAAAGPWALGYGISGKNLLAFMFLSGNWSIILFGWPGWALDVLWSISVEEQFYLFWGALVKWVNARNFQTIALGMIAFSVVVRMLLFVSHAPYEWFWYNTFARLDPIAAGILLAASPKLSAFRLPRFSMFLSLAGIVLCQRWFNVEAKPATFLDVTLGYLLPALLCGIVLKETVDAGAENSHTGFLNRIAVYLGQISYGLYIWHRAVLDFVNRQLPNPHGKPLIMLGIIGLSLCFTTALAMFSYHSYEERFLKLKRRFYPSANEVTRVSMAAV